METKAKISAAVLALVMGGSSAYVITDQLLDEVEGPSSPKVYQDGANVWTDCRGNTFNVDPARLRSQAECDEVDRNNLQYFIGVVDRNVTYPIQEPTRAALASFAYNVGEGNFKRSTLLRKLNQGDVQGACAELDRWVYVGGRNCASTRWRADGCYGVVSRREMERALCELGS